MLVGEFDAWEGETEDELRERLGDARRIGSSRPVPTL
jgi:hypothetical protein